jgi:hypothetical protein
VVLVDVELVGMMRVAHIAIAACSALEWIALRLFVVSFSTKGCAALQVETLHFASRS